jgi:dynein heavy chain
LIAATTEVFSIMVTQPQFMPSARKFHYQFNLRDFSKIVQNLMLTIPQLYKGSPEKMVRLWLHECNRVYLDRLIFLEDSERYTEIVKGACKNFDVNIDVLFEEPLIYTSFVSHCEGHDKAYLPIRDKDQLKKVLEEKLAEYNENVSSMDLVLFDQAMEHVTRIARIIDQPSGNALLIGVGGSGKQSLSKLASFLLSYDVIRIMVSTSYGMVDLKADLATMFTKAGCSGTQLLFILTDAQITKESFLVYINDVLSSGYVPDLFAKDEIDGVLGKIRNEAKSAGYMDTPDQLFDFFLDKIKKNLHLALCFSPVGDTLRIRARKFPGMINCTSIDWFHEWPKVALIDVATRFLIEIEFPNEEVLAAIALHMSDVHISIDQANQDYLTRERRYNYTTPTSFLELINFYKSLLDKKRTKISDQINRLEIGLGTMQETTEQVEGLKKELDIKMIDVGEKKEATNKLLEVVGRESLEAEREQGIAEEEEAKTIALSQEAQDKMASCSKELEEALPAMKAAEESVACLTKASIQELKALPKPPEECVVVTKTVLLLRGERKNFAWQNAQKMMNNPAKFIEEIQQFDGNNIDQWILDQLKPILDKEFFQYEKMVSKSQAAAFLCKWVVNIVTYNSIYKKVKPLKDMAEEAENKAKDAEASLLIVKAHVADIKDKVDQLKAKLEEAEQEKAAVEAEAGALQDKLELAERLVGGLADENKRWGQNVKDFKVERTNLIGDSLISAAFVSYIAPFSAMFRQNLWQDVWLPDIVEKKIPYTEGVDPLTVLASPSDQAIWKTEGLPADRVSLENASVITSCSRWPLIIDPQLQGQKWIKGKEGNELNIIQLSQKGWLKKIEMAVTNGTVLMIENVPQEIDAVLDPLLGRQITKKGKNSFTIKLGSEDIEYSKSFRLYLQTKLINPHYKPELAASCTIINFIVTESGLEDQLLAAVVRVEKPDLEQTKEDLVNKQNQF